VVGFLKAVFDARGEERIGVPAKVQIGDSIVMTSDGGGQREAMPAFLYVYVEDADRTYQRAVETGAASIEKPKTRPMATAARQCGIRGETCGKSRLTRKTGEPSPRDRAK
jgi:uncharacterized glyoxalase superfamily protein PhnB